MKRLSLANPGGVAPKGFCPRRATLRGGKRYQRVRITALAWDAHANSLIPADKYCELTWLPLWQGGMRGTFKLHKRFRLAGNYIQGELTPCSHSRLRRRGIAYPDPLCVRLWTWVCCSEELSTKKGLYILDLENHFFFFFSSTAQDAVVQAGPSITGKKNPMNRVSCHSSRKNIRVTVPKTSKDLRNVDFSQNLKKKQAGMPVDQKVIAL